MMENFLKELKSVVDYNYKQLEKVEGDQNLAENLITLSHDDFEVYDPFTDETMMDKVNPIKYYGLTKVKNMIDNYKNR